MLKIRLKKTGRKNAPAYRIVVADSGKPRDGETLEILGHYNPSCIPTTFEIDKERVEFWKARGAQPTKAVVSLLDGTYEFKKYKGSDYVEPEAEEAPEKEEVETKTEPETVEEKKEEK